MSIKPPGTFFPRRHRPATGDPPARGNRRKARAAAVLAAVALAAAAGLFIYSQVHGPAAPGHTGPAGRPRPPAGAAAHPFVPPALTLLATTHGTIPKFAGPGGPRTGLVPGRWHYARSTLPVIARRPGWLDVRLAQRPNESTAWVLARDVTLTTTRYAIVIDLASTHLRLYIFSS